MDLPVKTSLFFCWGNCHRSHSIDIVTSQNFGHFLISFDLCSSGVSYQRNDGPHPAYGVSFYPQFSPATWMVVQWKTQTMNGMQRKVYHIGCRGRNWWQTLFSDNRSGNKHLLCRQEFELSRHYHLMAVFTFNLMPYFIHAKRLEPIEQSDSEEHHVDYVCRFSVGFLQHGKKPTSPIHDD